MVIQRSEAAPKLDWSPQVKTPAIKLPGDIPGGDQKGGQMPEMPQGLPNQSSTWQGGGLRTMEFGQTFAMDATNSTGKASLKQKSEAMAIANQFIQALKSLQPPMEPSLLEPIVDRLGKIVAKLGEQIRAIEASGEKAPADQAPKDGPATTQASSSESPQASAPTEPQSATQTADKPDDSPKSADSSKATDSPKPLDPNPKPVDGTGQTESPEGNHNQDTGYTEGKATSEPVKPEKAKDPSSDSLLKMLQDKRISASIRGMLDQQAYQQLVSWLKQHQSQ